MQKALQFIGLDVANRIIARKRNGPDRSLTFVWRKAAFKLAMRP
mgnify:CR=1